MTKKDTRAKKRIRAALKTRYPGAKISIRSDGPELFVVRVVHPAFQDLRMGMRFTLLTVVLSPLTDRGMIFKPLTPAEFAARGTR